MDRHWSPYSERMEAKYWPYINFVGHFETIQEDSKALLQRIGAWKAHGETGWGEYYNRRIFGEEQTLHAQTKMSNVVVLAEQKPETLDLVLELRVDTFYQRDYDNPLFNLTKTPMFKRRLNLHIQTQTVALGTTTFHDKNNKNSGGKMVLDPNDFVYHPGDWDVAPIVVEKYKLVFFTIPKVACTTWKQAFGLMIGYDNWYLDTEGLEGDPHDPNLNGLRYLYHFPIETAHEMMTSPHWTRAIFVRDPKIRFLSAFMDKA